MGKLGVRRFEGNPFIEALPLLPSTKSDFIHALEHYPPPPRDAIRKQSEIVKLMEMQTIKDLVFPFPEYQGASVALATILRDSYVARNPLSVTDVQRRHALAMGSGDGLEFPANWKSSAEGYALLAVSGMGKTTFISSFLLGYPQVIRHTEYHDKKLKCHQIVYLVLRVPHDATLKSLLFQFFDEVDHLLGTN